MGRGIQILFMMAIWVFGLANLVNGFSPAQHQLRADNAIHADSVQTKSPTGAMLRSLVVPGWGQFYNGKWLKGLLTIGLETGLVVNAIYLNRQLQKSSEPLDIEFYRNNRNLSYWWLGATIFVSMIDAYVDAHLFDFDESPDLSFLYERNTFAEYGQTNERFLIFSYRIHF